MRGCLEVLLQSRSPVATSYRDCCVGAQPTCDGRSPKPPAHLTPIGRQSSTDTNDPKIKKNLDQTSRCLRMHIFPDKNLIRHVRGIQIPFSSRQRSEPPALPQPHSTVDPLRMLPQSIRARITGSSTCDSIKNAIRTVASKRRICGCATS
jgi:hypothetical protein